MKKHLAIVCGVYYPEPSPTGLCVKRFAKLLADEFDIEIICVSEDGKATIAWEKVNEDKDCSIKIHSVGCKRLEFENRSHGVTNKIIHSVGSLQIKTHLLGNLTWYRKVAVKKLEEIQRKKNLDAIFTICSPLAAHYAGMDMKKKYPEIRHCGYTVDPYSSKNRIRPFWMKYGQLVEYERNLYRQMECILLSEEIIESRPDLLRGVKNYAGLPYMLPEPVMDYTKEKLYPKEGINCVYAGRFYKELRNPEYMLRMFAQLEQQKVNLHLFYVGCENIVEQYAKKYSNIIIHKQVSHEMMGAVYGQADVLVGIGNATSEFFPSKTFEYISTGKPIVFINHADMKNEILDSYPAALQVSDKKIISAEQLKEFCEKYAKKTVSMNEIERIYYKHSKENICKILSQACGII